MGTSLVTKHVESSSMLSRAWKLLTSDPEVRALLRMSNVNAVKRLLYNDHGPVHAVIVSGSALEIFNILLESGIQPSSVMDGTVPGDEYARLIVLLAAYMHDIGNAVHRSNHEFAGALLAKGIMDRILPKVLERPYEEELIYNIEAEVMHAIYATSMNVDALTIEASIVKVADATDMAEGRARLPYSRGKTDIHAISALSIKRVDIDYGSHRPLRIRVEMKNPAGVFQIEKVLMPKINTSLIREYIEIVPVVLDAEEIHLDPIYP
ncbi:MAG: HD domain-containing protein [Desulfurococcales archaeon]|nr:HD domain-containing protein [Desulfurococcales archaeon]